MHKILPTLLFTLAITATEAQVDYPYPVHYFSLQVENKAVRMAYMDVVSTHPNGKTVMLFHGKNFNGYYWRTVIPSLVENGYRVVVPDQLGWGMSDKPELHYSFHMLANNSKLLLDSLGIKEVMVTGHSMGGMLAVRFALMFPSMTEKLVLENPIGLEDYKRFVPYQPLEKIFAKESSATYETYKKYQQSYYPEWKPEYEQYVRAQAAALADAAFQRIAWVNAITYQMIYEQPVIYELASLTVPCLLIIGLADRTIVGKDLLTEAEKKEHGQYQLLGKNAKMMIRNSKLAELAGIGHIPHIQDEAAFLKVLLSFLEEIKN